MSRAFLSTVIVLVICAAGVRAEADKEKEVTGTVKAR